MFDEIWRAEEIWMKATLFVVVMELIFTTLVMVYMIKTKQKIVEKEVTEVVVEK